MTEMLSDVSLVFWNLGDAEPPSVSSVREALEDSGISRSYAEDVPPSTAFRRACDDQRNKKMLVRIFKKDGDLHAQLDHEKEEDGRLRRELAGVYRCHSSLVVRGVGYDYNRLLEEALDRDFRLALHQYEWGDISTTIQNILTKCGLGAYSPRKNGGVYFIPQNPANPQLLDKLEAFCNRVGVRFLRYAVPDTASQRAEVMDAVAAGIEADVTAHEEAVAGYTEANSGVMDRRVNAIDSTLHLLDRLRHLLGVRHAALVERLNALKGRLVDMKQTVSSAVRPIGGRRLSYV